MTIECYYDTCPYHDVHAGGEGPFCLQEECRATNEQLIEYGKIRQAYLAERTSIRPKTVRGDLLEMAENGDFDVIAHGCNCFCKMGGGIARKIREAYPTAARADMDTEPGDKSKLGLFTYALNQGANKSFHIVNLYTQYQISRGEDVFEYDAFQHGLRLMYRRFGDVRYGIPLIGMGLAMGDRDRIMNIIREASVWMDITLVVYKP